MALTSLEGSSAIKVEQRHHNVSNLKGQSNEPSSEQNGTLDLTSSNNPVQLVVCLPGFSPRPGFPYTPRDPNNSKCGLKKAHDEQGSQETFLICVFCSGR